GPRPAVGTRSPRSDRRHRRTRVHARRRRSTRPPSARAGCPRDDAARGCRTRSPARSAAYPAHGPGPANRLDRAAVPVAGCGRPPARAAWRSAWSWPLPGRLFACRALHPDLRSVLIVPVVLPFVLEQAPALVGPSAPLERVQGPVLRQVPAVASPGESGDAAGRVDGVLPGRHLPDLHFGHRTEERLTLGIDSGPMLPCAQPRTVRYIHTPMRVVAVKIVQRMILVDRFPLWIGRITGFGIVLLVVRALDLVGPGGESYLEVAAVEECADELLEVLRGTGRLDLHGQPDPSGHHGRHGITGACFGLPRGSRSHLRGLPPAGAR